MKKELRRIGILPESVDILFVSNRDTGSCCTEL
jgi:hypothetical protein